MTKETETMVTESEALAYLTRCADDQGNHWFGGVKVGPDDCPTCHGTNDAGHLRAPCSPYGRTSAECAPVAYALYRIYCEANGLPDDFRESLTFYMGLVVNGHEDVTSLILTHGTAADRELIEDALYCDLCNDHGHVPADHGDPLVIRDTGQRTVIDAVEVYVLDAMTLCQDAAQDASFQRLSALYDDWTDIDTDDERDEYATDYLTDIDAILSDAGFLPITNPDQGAWLVYGPVTH